MTALLLCVWASAAAAGGPQAVRKQVQASMQVTGMIDIQTDGKVGGYRIDHPEKLSPDLLQLVASSVPSWEFEPVLQEGRAVAVSTSVGIRLVAKPADGGGHEVSIQDASFEAGNDGYGPRILLLVPPLYPTDMAQRSASGTVYLVLKVGRQGTVEDVIVEQVNLRVVASEYGMAQMRRRFSQSALQAARGWTFSPPVLGPDVDASHWSLRVPVDFVLGEDPSEQYGRWIGYVPGPRRDIPWADDEDDFAAAPDAMVPGSFYSSRNGGPRLLTRLGSN
ncbi:MAG: energy transducer TonB [Pseudomonadota bacterium]|nr:energy transducer TonB [Pseudomonadota bacterium]